MGVVAIIWYQRVHFLFRVNIPSFTMKIHCRIQKCLHKLMNTKTCIYHHLKRKIFLPILFLNSLEHNQRFRILKHDPHAIMNNTKLNQHNITNLKVQSWKLKIKPSKWLLKCLKCILKFHMPIICNFAVIHPWNLLFS